MPGNLLDALASLVHNHNCQIVADSEMAAEQLDSPVENGLLNIRFESLGQAVAAVDGYFRFDLGSLNDLLTQMFYVGCDTGQSSCFDSGVRFDFGPDSPPVNVIYGDYKNLADTHHPD